MQFLIGKKNSESENNFSSLLFFFKKFKIEKTLSKYYNNVGGKYKWKKQDIKIFN